MECNIYWKQKRSSERSYVTKNKNCMSGEGLLGSRLQGEDAKRNYKEKEQPKQNEKEE